MSQEKKLKFNEGSIEKIQFLQMVVTKLHCKKMHYKTLHELYI